ncbi:MAG TPA: hypothetical protein VJY62_18910 [Bacteroidia bacterium]|nr:hypothetical protein [Bacteroidia bacterium]
MTNIKKYLLLFYTLQLNFSCNSQPPVVSVSINTHQTKTLSKNYFLGFNTQLLHGPSMNDTAFVTAIKGLHPSILRYPGGTVANQWDWKTGWTTAAEFKNLPVIPYRLEDFKKAIDVTGAMSIFVLNMCTSTLDNQVAMLKHAQEIGLPVKLIELGNEFYMPLGLYVKTFPAGSDYAHEANRWTERLKREFPEAEIAVVGKSEKKEGLRNKLRGKDSDERSENWNSELFKSIKNADAVTFHIYGGNGLDYIHTGKQKIKHQKRSDYADEERKIFQDAFESSDASKIILGMPFHRVKQFIENDTRNVPKGMKIWITECNMFEKTGIVSGSWLHGLYAATLCLLLAESGKTDIVLYHTLAKDATFAAIFNNTKGFEFNYKKPLTTKNSYSASGYALSLLMEAAKNKKKISPLIFDQQFGVTTNAESYNSLFGYSFSDDVRKNYFIINLSPKTIPLNSKNLNLKNASFVQISCDPLKQITSKNDFILKEGFITNEKIELEPFSVLEIRSEN